MTTPAQPPVVAPAGSGLSEPQRIINTFVAPSKTFADIRHNTSWWVPWVVLSIFALLFSYAVDQKITWERIVENQIAKSPSASARMDKMSAEDRDRMITMQAKVSKGIGYATPVFVIVMLAISAGVLMLIFNFGFGAKLDFGHSMAIVAYSWLATVVSTVLAIITMFAGADPEGFNIRNPVATNPAYFMDATKTNGALYGALSALDIIGIWCCFLMAVGVSENSKVKKMTAFVTLFALYFAMKFIGGALGGAFGG